MLRRSAGIWVVVLALSCGGERDHEPSGETGAVDAGLGLPDAGWEYIVEMGLIDHGDGPDVRVPDSARAGEPIAVTVMTYGSSTCHEGERLDLEQTEETVDLVPYDRRWILPPQYACTADLATIPHRAEITFATPGPRTLRVHGRKWNYDDGGVKMEEVVEVIRTITVE